MDAPATEWWKTYFHGPTNDVFRMLMAPRASTDATKIERALALPPASKILDVPCGHGRIAIELAARGHVVAGLDLSAEEIARAKAAARERNVEVDFRIGDMRTAVPAEAFDATVCFGNSFGYFDDDDNAAFLRSLLRSLRPGGKLALETSCCLESYLPGLAERPAQRWWKQGEIYLLHSETLDVEAGRLNIDQTYLTLSAPSTAPEVRKLSCRIYSCRELVTLLRSSGFDDVRCLDGTANAPFRIGAPLLLVATRPA
jgi:SAM-dependent methyltransferase